MKQSNMQVQYKSYEKTAYGYKKHPKSAEAGYAAIIAYNEWLES